MDLSFVIRKLVILLLVNSSIVAAGSIGNIKKQSKINIRQRRFIQFKILFGTKWCGDGNRAKHSTDYGYWLNLDKCCAQHDQCPLKIHHNKQRWGVQNTIGYTVTDCKCDDEFHDCLKKISGWESYVAWTVGKIFFNWLSVPCLHIPPTTDYQIKEKPIQTNLQKTIIRGLRRELNVTEDSGTPEVHLRIARDFKK